jgi:hypothetical protein
MTTNEEQRISREAARAAALRGGGVTRYELAMQRYLAAEAFETHPESAPEGWEGKPQHPAPVRTNLSADS